MHIVQLYCLAKVQCLGMLGKKTFAEQLGSRSNCLQGSALRGLECVQDLVDRLKEQQIGVFELSPVFVCVYRRTKCLTDLGDVVFGEWYEVYSG